MESEQPYWPRSKVLKSLFRICPKSKTSIKKWLYKLFAIKIEIEAFVVCGIIAFCGILCTSIINIKAWNEISSLLGIVYLFFMAMLEEIAWRRGFIDVKQLKQLGEELKMTDYGQYLLSLAEGTR